MSKLVLEKYIDHTLLKPEAAEEAILSLCNEAKQYNFAAVCINPCWVLAAARELSETDIKVCTVIGFPLGANIPIIKLSEAKTALAAGAREIDVVINIGRIKMRHEMYVVDELKRLSEACKSNDALLKVILETGLLTEEEKVFAAQAALKAGADYVKTSTGFLGGGATASDVSLLKATVGDKAKVKASGGIRNLEHALNMINAGADRIGTSGGVAIIKEYLAGSENA